MESHYRKIILIFSLLAAFSIGYLLTPLFPMNNWEKVDSDNAILGKFPQTTGATFEVSEQKVNAQKYIAVNQFEGLELMGNSPLETEEFGKCYEAILSEYILYGEITGTVTIEGLGEIAIFEVSNFEITNYLPNYYSLTKLNMFFYFVSTLSILTVLVIYRLYGKKKKY